MAMLGFWLALFGIVGSSCTASCPDAPGDNAPIYLVDRLELATAFDDRGRRLDVRRDGGLSSPVTLDFETRLSLTPPLPSRIEFDLLIPAEPVLTLAIATSPVGTEPVWAPVEFRVLVDADGDSASVIEESLTHAQANRWLDRTIDLASWQGRQVKLVLETRVSGPSERVRRAARRVAPLWGNPVVQSRTARPERPTLVLVSIDCLRADHVSAYGYHRLTTPNIDALAADGTIFESAASVSSWTLPTHLSMLTGRLPSFHGVRRKQKLSPDIAFLPEILRQAGYQVDGVASWYFLSQVFGFDRGFHSYRLMVGDDAEDVVDAALDVLHRSEGRDQFLFLHLIDAHWPYLPPDDYIDRFGRPRDISSTLKLVQSRKAPPSPADAEDVIRLYDAEIAYADEHLGRLVQDLKSRDLYDDALIIVTADHGEAFYEHGHWQHTVSLYDQITHIPLIVKWPEGSRPKRSTLPASQIDVFPTILEAAGIEPPDTGAVSLAQQLSTPDERRGVLSELTSPLGRLQGCHEPPLEKGECLAVRLATLKYIASLSEQDGEVSTVNQELYDIDSDPLERNDLSKLQPAAAERMLARIHTFLRTARNQQMSAEDVILDDETAKALESLGYVQ